MSYIFTLILLVLIAGIGLLYHRLRLQNQRLDHALAQLDELGTGRLTSREPQLVLTLRVLDPIAVAKRESRSARILADRLPVMVQKMVYQQVMKEVGEELAARDIDVELNVEYR
ncbi:hypothetical protein [Marinobacter salicampi]|uniref:hypothetical protein n=1 Tax=Marinobacter salicampi TaxID=435907 RepID=UPI001F5F617E|nr:hypothetical protein [Marinobacter salicampi]